MLGCTTPPDHLDIMLIHFQCLQQRYFGCSKCFLAINYIFPDTQTCIHYTSTNLSEYSGIEKLLQLLIAVVDAELFKAVHLEVFCTTNIV